jgi:hypothetical protein
VSTNFVKANPSKGKQIDMCFYRCVHVSPLLIFWYTGRKQNLWEKLLSNVSHIPGDVKIQLRAPVIFAWALCDNDQITTRTHDSMINTHGHFKFSLLF